MNRNKAILILIMSAIIYVFSYPFHKTFIGGLVYYGSCASLIGGLADWWGINKLLKKTIPKNKEKIFDGLSNMVSEELLTKENLKNLLNTYDTSKFVIEIVRNNDEYENIKTVIKEMIEEYINNTNINGIEEITSNLIINNLKKFKLHKVIISVIESSIKNGYDDKIYNFIIKEIKLLSETDDFKNILIELINKIRTSYEGENLFKKVIDDIFINTNEVLDYIKNFLGDFENKDNINRLRLKEWINDKLDKFKNSEDIKIKIEEWKMEQFKNMKLEEYISMILLNTSNMVHKSGSLTENAFNIINNQIDIYIDNLNNSVDAQIKVDVFIKNILNKLINDGHENVGKIVKENLNKYNDTMLIELIESNVGNDLQLIRINGSFVGGLVGIIMFVLKYITGV